VTGITDSSFYYVLVRKKIRRDMLAAPRLELPIERWPEHRNRIVDILDRPPAPPI
jgi:hypothetical protein